MERENNFLALVLLMLFAVISCKNTSIECEDVQIEIENRWYNENRGLDYLVVNNKKDISFMCSRITNFPDGKEIQVSYNHGYLTIFFNNRKVDVIFTVRNGVIYRVGIGKYVYDEALTKRIMKLMKITNRCWGEGCK